MAWRTLEIWEIWDVVIVTVVIVTVIIVIVVKVKVVIVTVVILTVIVMVVKVIVVIVTVVIMTVVIMTVVIAKGANFFLEGRGSKTILLLFFLDGKKWGGCPNVFSKHPPSGTMLSIR